MLASLVLAATLAAGAPGAGDAEPPHLAPSLAVPGDGTFQPGALLQTWLLVDDGPLSTCKAAGPGCATQLATFRLRRVQLDFHGTLVGGLFAYRASFDPSRAPEFETKTVQVSAPGSGSVSVSQPNGPATIMQDLYLTLQLAAVEITFGQFRIPLSLEGYSNSAALLFPERALVSRAYGDRRDAGVKFAKRYTHFGYVAALLNGSGQNRLDTELSKDAVLRLEAYPVRGLLVGLVGFTTVGGRFSSARDRGELDVRYEAGPLLLQAELIRARDRALASGLPVTSHSFGYYIAAGYKVTDTLQPIARFGHNDPQLGGKAAGTAPFSREVTFYEFGLNYFIYGDNAKVQCSLSSFQYERLPAETAGILGLQLYY